MDDDVSFVDDARHRCLDDSGTDPAIEDMTSFLSSCLELARRKKFFHVLKLFCLSLGHIVTISPRVELGFGWIGTENVDLSCIIQPLQWYLFSSDSKGNFFTNPDSIDGCLASLDTFCDKTLQIEYNPWSFVNNHDYEKIYSE